MYDAILFVAVLSGQKLIHSPERNRLHEHCIESEVSIRFNSLSFQRLMNEWKLICTAQEMPDY